MPSPRRRLTAASRRSLCHTRRPSCAGRQGCLVRQLHGARQPPPPDPAQPPPSDEVHHAHGGLSIDVPAFRLFSDGPRDFFCFRHRALSHVMISGPPRQLMQLAAIDTDGPAPVPGVQARSDAWSRRSREEAAATNGNAQQRPSPCRYSGRSKSPGSSESEPTGCTATRSPQDDNPLACSIVMCPLLIRQEGSCPAYAEPKEVVITVGPRQQRCHQHHNGPCPQDPMMAKDSASGI